MRPSIEEAGREPLLVDDRTHDGPRWLTRLLALTATAAAVALSFLLLRLPGREPLIPSMVSRNLPTSGISNPVNGVLLDFRAYDTLLEITVLLVAVVAVWSLDRGVPPRTRDAADRADDPVLHELARLVVPLAGTAAIYLVWAGGHRPGGGFQAGALLAGAGVLLAAGGYVPALSAASRAIRGTVALATVVFVVVGVAGLVLTGSFLRYPPGGAYPLVVAVEAAIAATVAAALTELFVDVPAVPARDPSLRRVHPTGDPLGRMLTRAGSGEGDR